MSFKVKDKSSSSLSSTNRIIINTAIQSTILFTIIVIAIITATIHVNHTEAFSSPFRLDPDETRSFAQLIQSRGYQLQEHHLTTADDYEIVIHRILPLNYDATTYSLYRKPVVVFHGIFCDSSVFFLNSPHLFQQPSSSVDNITTSNNNDSSSSTSSSCGDNFGFCMINTGRYDLWIPNARANGVSRGHRRYTESDRRYWKFSWDRIGLYDIPAFLNHIRRVTKHDTVGYVGYSQGVSSLLVLLTLHPEYAQMIRPLITWAPAVFMGNAKTFIRPPMLTLLPVLERFPGEFWFTESWMRQLKQIFCRSGLGLLGYCTTMLRDIFGPSKNLNESRMATYHHFIPARASNWQVAHFAQNSQMHRFAFFDYGVEKNNRLYGRSTPPDFPLWNLPKNLTIVVMYGSTDWFVDPIDARTFISTLRSYNLKRVIDHPITTETWNHLDFLLGTGAGRLVYEPTVQYLDRYAWGELEFNDHVLVGGGGGGGGNDGSGGIDTTFDEHNIGDVDDDDRVHHDVVHIDVTSVSGGGGSGGDNDDNSEHSGDSDGGWDDHHHDNNHHQTPNISIDNGSRKV